MLFILIIFTREREKLAEDLKEQMEELKLREEEVRTVTHAHTHTVQLFF